MNDKDARELVAIVLDLDEVRAVLNVSASLLKGIQDRLARVLEQCPDVKKEG
jgi:hypothetical protein